MNKTLLLLLGLLFTIAIVGQEASGKLVILHTNDLHSNLTGFSPELEYSPCITGDDGTMGGFSRIAGLIANEKEKNKEHLLVLDAGDFLMGTFFHVIEEQTGFQLPLMKRMGYDVLGIGNHEFDFGPNAFANIINKSMENGEIPLLTLANIKFTRDDPRDMELKNLYDKDIIKRYHILERDGLRIGIFGLMGEDADEVAPGKTPVEFPNRIRTARRTVRTLQRDENVDLIICLSHSGLRKGEDGNWKGEDVELANRVGDIDIIISGHSHSVLTEPVWVDETIIVQAGSQGKHMGRLEVYVNDREISLAKFQLLNVDDNIKGDCHIHKDIASQIRMVDKKLLRPLGFGYYLPVAETHFDLNKRVDSDLNKGNLGPFLADAIHYYVNSHSGIEADIAMIAAGVIRDDIKTGNHGVQIAPDIFRVVSLGEGNDSIPGYPLAKVYLTGRELKNMFEVLYIAPSISDANHCYYSGVKIHIDENRGLFRKVQKIEINGKEIDTGRRSSELYSVVANSYMLEFVGMIRSMTFGLLNVKPKDAKGNRINDNKDTWIDFNPNTEQTQEGKEWIAVLKFIQTFEDKTGNGIPNIPKKYKDSIHRVVSVNE